MIEVTKPFLPPVEEYLHYVKQIFDRKWLTNRGPFVLELESNLRKKFELDHFHFTSSGTIALQLLIKALELKGEIITTPFSYVATTSSIVWEGCKPVFADIDKNSLTIDPDAIEALITNKTSAIIATHVYGIPCDVEKIDRIADKYGLIVIYDAAHAFGTEYLNKSLLSFGHASIISTHATKIFHTSEGGGIITSDKDLSHRIQLMRNFGHDGPGKFSGIGINAKNSEFHAAMGIAVLPYMDEILKKRKHDADYYDKLLHSYPVRRPQIPEGTIYNNSYYPIILPTDLEAVKVMNHLEEEGIFGRRYFYPLLSTLDYVEKTPTPVAEDISSRVVCLPMFHELKDPDIEFITGIIKKIL